MDLPADPEMLPKCGGGVLLAYLAEGVLTLKSGTVVQMFHDTELCIQFEGRRSADLTVYLWSYCGNIPATIHVNVTFCDLVCNTQAGVVVCCLSRGAIAAGSLSNSAV